MERFRTMVAVEGSKRGLKITVPRAAAKLLHPFETGWARLHIDGYEPAFVFVRRPPSRPYMEISLSSRTYPPELAGREIEATIEDARPYRAPETPRLLSDGFDWLPLVHEDYFPTETVDGRLVLHNRHEEPFAMKRVTPLESTYRLLGLYQAEGAKADTVLDFRIGSTNPALLKCFSELLTTIGLGPARQMMEIQRAHHEPQAKARAEFEILGVEITAERFRSTESLKNHTAADLKIRNSQPLRRLFAGALGKVFAAGFTFPSKDTAREYALGWLDGDGTITIVGDTSVDLRLAGYADEHAVTNHALRTAFGWAVKGGQHTIPDYTTAITLRAHEMLQLLDAGAFMFSMSRVRLLLAFDRRTEGLRNGERHGAYARWGLVDRDGMLTDVGEAVCKGHARWAAEIKRAALLAPPSGIVREKGVANPLNVPPRRISK